MSYLSRVIVAEVEKPESSRFVLVVDMAVPIHGIRCEEVKER